VAGTWKADAGLIDVEFTNGAKIAAGFAVAPKEMRAELRKSHTQTAKEAQKWIRSGAQQGTPQQRHMGNAIQGRGNSTQAIIAIVPTKKTAGAQGTFYGAKQFKQFPTWVGNTWTPGVSGQGPYVINPVLAARQNDLDVIFLEGQAQAVARAVPRF